MANDRMDVISFKENAKTGKVFAVRLGSAVASKKGDGWNLYLDAIPAPMDGQYRLSVVPPREKRERQPGEDDGDSEVPF